MTLVTVLLALMPTGASSLADAVVVHDASGRTVTVEDASRIISVGGSITEILYALGLEDRVLAVDSTSFYPRRALQEKPNVGYMRQLSPEGVLGLAPSLVLAVEGAGPKETLAVLEAATVPLVRIPDPFTGEGIVKKVRLVAQATGAGERGVCLAKAVEVDLAALAQVRSRVTTPVRVVFVLSLVEGRAMVAGGATAADGIIRLAGAVNAVTGYDGYKAITDEALMAAKPDVVLVMQRDSHPITAESVFALPAFAVTPAAERKAFVSMDGLYLLGFGPRTALAARDLAAALYPGLRADLLPSERARPIDEACRG